MLDWALEIEYQVYLSACGYAGLIVEFKKLKIAKLQTEHKTALDLLEKLQGEEIHFLLCVGQCGGGED